MDVFNENTERSKTALAMDTHWLLFALKVLLTFLTLLVFIREEEFIKSHSNFKLFLKYLFYNRAIYTQRQ